MITKTNISHLHTRMCKNTLIHPHYKEKRLRLNIQTFIQEKAFTLEEVPYINSHYFRIGIDHNAYMSSYLINTYIVNFKIT